MVLIGRGMVVCDVHQVFDQVGGLRVSNSVIFPAGLSKVKILGLWKCVSTKVMEKQMFMLYKSLQN